MTSIKWGAGNDVVGERRKMGARHSRADANDAFAEHSRYAGKASNVPRIYSSLSNVLAPSKNIIEGD